jgi:hypothetical protein
MPVRAERDTLHPAGEIVTRQGGKLGAPGYIPKDDLVYSARGESVSIRVLDKDAYLVSPNNEAVPGSSLNPQSFPGGLLSSSVCRS